MFKIWDKVEHKNRYAGWEEEVICLLWKDVDGDEMMVTKWIDWFFNAEEISNYQLVEIEELTLEEVCDELWREIKIIK